MHNICMCGFIKYNTESKKEQLGDKQSPVGVDASVHGCSCVKQLEDVLILTPLEADLIVQHLCAAQPWFDSMYVSLLALDQIGRWADTNKDPSNSVHDMQITHGELYSHNSEGLSSVVTATPGMQCNIQR